MRRALGVLLGLILLLPLSLYGQEEEGPPPELRLLDRFVGEWTFEGSGGGSGTQVCDWIGEYFLQCETEGTNASGETSKNVVVWSYDAEEDVFIQHRFLYSGWSDVCRGWMSEDTWTCLFDSPDAPWGTQYRMTMTFTEGPQMVWSLKMESSEKVGPWEVYAESGGTLTKIR